MPRLKNNKGEVPINGLNDTVLKSNKYMKINFAGEGSLFRCKPVLYKSIHLQAWFL